MNSSIPPDAVERSIDAALARLPDWQPPRDFSMRLAAAAARAEAELAVPPEPAWSAWLAHINDLTPAVLAAAGLAVAMGWIIPWSQLSGTGLVWTCVAAMSAAGAYLTLRVLRSP
jgi:hypothetical protein